jgi:glyoxylase-like metal-dependent hydrolase (beta-lactamase superfamily II)
MRRHISCDFPIAEGAPFMRVHHLNCISTCPLGGKLMDGHTDSLFRRGRLTCHCLLVETNSSLVLIDTGLGLRDVADPKSRLSWFFLSLVSPDFREEMTAVRQIERMGFDPHDVWHIVLTHLDFDHAGGLDDFPGAKVHMLASEREAAVAQKTWLDRQRFRPQQWSTRDQWQVYQPGDGEPWFGFERVRPLEGLPPEIALIPLIGHTFGHAGVAIRGDDKWLLQTGDAYFYHAEMDVTRPRCTPGLRFYQWMMEKDRRSRLTNQNRLRALRRDHPREVEVFCSHDLLEFERLSGRSFEVPPERIVRPAARETRPTPRAQARPQSDRERDETRAR